MSYQQHEEIGGYALGQQTGGQLPKGDIGSHHARRNVKCILQIGRTNRETTEVRETFVVL